MSVSNVIEISDVSYSFGPLKVLEHVSFSVQDGEFLGLVGPNGGGKTTLLKLVLGLLRPDQGTVRVLGTTVDEARRRLGYVPQYAGFQRDYPITVEEAVMLGCLGRNGFLFRWSPRDRTAAAAAMNETEIYDLRKRRIGALSGGQLQRVLIARALASEPEILVLDEPTANIDLRMEENVFELLRQLNQRMTIVVVSHDIGFISRYVKRVACLNRTLVCHQTSVLSGELIKDLYGAVRIIPHEH